jgi:hypothetical protein
VFACHSWIFSTSVILLYPLIHNAGKILAKRVGLRADLFNQGRKETTMPHNR